MPCAAVLGSFVLAALVLGVAGIAAIGRESALILVPFPARHAVLRTVGRGRRPPILFRRFLPSGRSLSRLPESLLPAL